MAYDNEFYYERNQYGSGSYGNYRLSSSGKTKILEFMSKNTYYEIDTLKYKPDDQLFSMYYNTKKNMKKYIIEIKDAVCAHPELIGAHPELKNMLLHIAELKYNALCDMRKTLGLDKRTKQYKLYKDNTVKTIKQANLEEFHQFSIEELFGKFGDDSFTYITTEQGFKLFGERYSTMSVKELEKAGYKLVVSEEENKEAIYIHNELKDRMIIYISFRYYRTPKGEVYNEQQLRNMSLEELTNIYIMFQTFYQGTPSVETLKKGLLPQ